MGSLNSKREKGPVKGGVIGEPWVPLIQREKKVQ
jgi:hypothetical protein